MFKCEESRLGMVIEVVVILVIVILIVILIFLIRILVVLVVLINILLISIIATAIFLFVRIAFPWFPPRRKLTRTSTVIPSASRRRKTIRELAGRRCERCCRKRAMRTVDGCMLNDQGQMLGHCYMCIHRVGRARKIRL